MGTTTTTSTAHSQPPEVTLEGRGQWADIPVITLDLENGAIARSIVRQLARSLAHPVNGAYWLRIVAAGGPGAEEWVTKILTAAQARGTFQVELTHDAAQALHAQLTDVLDAAETECTQSGCVALGTLDGQCPNHADRADTRIGA